jgi:hypothetical protein
MKFNKSIILAIFFLGFTNILFSQALPNYVPSNGLVGWWPFNGNANDESGNGNDGTVNGATLVEDRFNNVTNAFSFSSTSSNSIQINASPSNVVSISGWFKCLTPNKYYPRIIYYGDGNILTSGPVKMITAGVMGSEPSWIGQFTGRFYSETNVSNSATNFNQTISDNAWHHFVVLLGEDAILKSYIDGQLATEIQLSTNVNITNGQFFIGRDPSDNFGGFSQGRFNGSIDDIGIWNRALTQDEITDLFNSVNCDNVTIDPFVNSNETGSTATFTATTSNPSPTYTWQSDFGQGFQTLNNFGNYSGIGTNTLAISNVQLSEHNQPIRVITTSGECIDTSDVAFISIIDTCINTVTDTSIISVTDTLIINTLITQVQPAQENTFLVYPNPAGSQITINNGNVSILGGYTMRITNSSGQEVYNQNITQTEVTLDLSNWGGNGLYVMYVVDPQGEIIAVKQIVLQ